MKKNLKKEKVLETILVMVVGFLVIYFFTKWQWLFYITLLIGIGSVLYFPFAKIVAKAWLKFAEVLGNINGKIILSLIFFLFLTPLAFFFRLFNKKDIFKHSSWKKRTNQFNESDFEKVW